MICNIPVYDSWGEEMKKISAYDKGVRVTILPDPDIGLVDLRLCFKVDFVLKNITESLKADSLDVSADEIQCTIPEKALQTRSGGTLDIYICLRNGAQQTTQYHAIVQVEGRPPLIQIDAEHVACDVKYYNHDGSELLYTETVLDGGNATWAGTGPSRPATPQNTYSFSGWAATPNGTRWADAQKNVTEDRNLYAAYTITDRTYTVTFKNGSTTLQTVNNVPYGGSATYSGNTSELVDPSGDGAEFQDWVPSPTNIQADTVCVASFEQPVVVDAEITDSWETIIANINNGTYKTKYQLGNYKPLDLGDDGTVNMQIVAFDRDAKASGSGYAPTTWIAKELITTNKRWNPDTNSGGWENSELRTNIRETILPTVPTNVRSAIVPVTKTQSLYGTPSTQTTTETLWIPSRMEMYGDLLEDGGRKYALFKDNASRVKHKVGSTITASYWTRSACTSSLNTAYLVEFWGDWSAAATDSSPNGLAVGFCL